MSYRYIELQGRRGKHIHVCTGLSHNIHKYLVPCKNKFASYNKSILFCCMVHHFMMFIQQQWYLYNIVACTYNKAIVLCMSWTCWAANPLYTVWQHMYGANINQANIVGTYTHTWCSLNLNCTCTTQSIVYKIKLQYCTCIEHAELWTLRKALNICMSYLSHAFSVHVYCVGAVWCVMLYPCLCIVIAWQLCCAGHWCVACPAAMMCMWSTTVYICIRKSATTMQVITYMYGPGTWKSWCVGLLALLSYVLEWKWNYLSHELFLHVLDS